MGDIDLNAVPGERGYHVPALASYQAARLLWAVGWRWGLASFACIGIFGLGLVELVALDGIKDRLFQGLPAWALTFGVFGLSGAAAGAAQRLALRRWLPLSAVWWPLATGVGVGAGVCVSSWQYLALRGYRDLFQMLPVDSLTQRWLYEAVPFMLLGLYIGAAQWLVLVRHLRYGWIWLLTSGLAAAVSTTIAKNLPGYWQIPAAFAALAAFTAIWTLSIVVLLRVQRRWTQFYVDWLDTAAAGPL